MLVCSGVSDSSTPVTVKQRLIADKLNQTQPNDHKFVGRLKTLSIGVPRSSPSTTGLCSLSLFLFDVIFFKRSYSVNTATSFSNSNATFFKVLYMFTLSSCFIMCSTVLSSSIF